MKKKIIKIITILCLVFACAGILGCTPSGYTKDGVKAVRTEHEAETRKWFSENMPGAKVTSLDACRDSSTLYQAISGTYRVSGNEYAYVYDYVENKMYTNEMEGQVREYLLEEAVRKVGVEADRSEISIETHRIPLLSANDHESNVKDYDHPPYGQLTDYGAAVYLYDSDPKDIAQSIIYDEEPIATFSVNTYSEAIPEYDPNVICSISGLNYVSYKTKMDYVYEGINSAVYYKTFARVTHTHLEEVEDNLYAGYTYEEELEVNDGNIIAVKNDSKEMGNSIDFSRTDSNNFELAVPVNTNILFFTTKGKYYDCFYNFAGEYKEFDMDRGSAEKYKYISDYDCFEAKYIVPDKNLYCYSLWGSRTPEDGKYHIKKK